MKYKDKEIWKPVVGHEEHYSVSSYGRVKNFRGRLLKPRKDGKNYRKVTLCFNGAQTDKKVHRIVAEAFLGDIQGMEIDHKDHNRANNAVRNLRVCSLTENRRNSLKSNGKLTQFKGVSFDGRGRKKYRAYIKVNKKQIPLGYFFTAEEAAKKYNEEAKKLFGKYAHINQVYV